MFRLILQNTVINKGIHTVLGYGEITDKIPNFHWFNLFPSTPTCFDQPIVNIIRIILTVGLLLLLIGFVVTLMTAGWNLVTSGGAEEGQKLGLQKVKNILGALATGIIVILLIFIILNGYVSTVKPENC
jgi:hypothetical protein